MAKLNKNNLKNDLKRRFNISAADLEREILPGALETLNQASALVMAFYDKVPDKTEDKSGKGSYAQTDPNGIKIEIKDDKSPVTEADYASSNLIVAQMKSLTPHITVVTEENKTLPRNSSLYWTWDPIDGTKEFLDKTGGFSIKGALLAEGRPILGAVAVPAFDTVYFSMLDGPAFKQVGKNAPIIIKTRPMPQKTSNIKTLFNLKHADEDLYERIRLQLNTKGLNLPADPDPRPSLPRSLQVAEGRADMVLNTGRNKTFPYGGGFAWDTAADNLIVQNAGGYMIDIINRKLLEYGNPRDRSPAFLTLGDRTVAEKVFPKLKNLANGP